MQVDQRNRICPERGRKSLCTGNMPSFTAALDWFLISIMHLFSPHVGCAPEMNMLRLVALLLHIEQRTLTKGLLSSTPGAVTGYAAAKATFQCWRALSGGMSCSIQACVLAKKLSSASCQDWHQQIG